MRIFSLSFLLLLSHMYCNPTVLRPFAPNCVDKSYPFVVQYRKSLLYIRRKDVFLRYDGDTDKEEIYG